MGTTRYPCGDRMFSVLTLVVKYMQVPVLIKCLKLNKHTQMSINQTKISGIILVSYGPDNILVVTIITMYIR